MTCRTRRCRICRQWLTGWQQGQLGVSLGVHRSGHGGRVPARAGIDRTSQGGWANAHAGRRQHRGGTRLGGGVPNAQRPEGGCLPCRGGTQLAWRHFFSFFFFLWKKAYMRIDANHISNPKDS